VIVGGLVERSIKQRCGSHGGDPVGFHISAHTILWRAASIVRSWMKRSEL
jgi:hypothetical protein